jgi:hypothetical protein
VSVAVSLFLLLLLLLFLFPLCPFQFLLAPVCTAPCLIRRSCVGDSDPHFVYNMYNLSGLITLAPHFQWGIFLECAKLRWSMPSVPLHHGDHCGLSLVCARACAAMGINYLPGVNVAEPTVLQQVDAIVGAADMYAMVSMPSSRCSAAFCFGLLLCCAFSMC